MTGTIVETDFFKAIFHQSLLRKCNLSLQFKIFRNLTAYYIAITARFVTDIPGYKDEHDDILGTWLDSILPKEGTWGRCFRSSPGWRGRHFHSWCDGKGPTLILIRVQENIFGGFLDKNWGGKRI